MATNEFESKNEITVHGYVRDNFDDDYWINEIVQIIVQFYRGKGGSLYVCGNGDYGRLGIEEYNDKICKSPTLCSLFQDITLDVSAGYRHMLILDVYGDVWSCGHGKYGKLGSGNDCDISIPQKLTSMQSVLQIAAGGELSLILLNNGNVLSCGQGKVGALGHGNDEDVLIPKVIESLKKYKIIQIAVGYEHSVCLAEDGDVFCFGDNDFGQCGVGEGKEESIWFPTKIEFEGFVVSIECGDEVTLFIDKNGSIYSCGRGDYGQLGHGDEDNRYEPTLIETLDAEYISDCSCGELHTICINKDGVVWSFGNNNNGQCGLAEEIESQFKPAVIKSFVENNIKAVQCSAGDDHSCIVSEDGDLYVFGCNEKYQLGLGEEHYYYTPQKVTLPQNISVKKVSASYEYTAVIFK